MHRIALVCSKPGDPEVAILQLSNEEHDELHHDPTNFVNKNRIFCKDVSRVDVVEHSIGKKRKDASAGWLILSTHYPSCVCPTVCMEL